MTPTPRQRAERAGAGLPPLLLAAERVAAGVAPGVHGRRRVGSGETFWQYREYAAGDPASTIDWRRSARGDRLFVRQTEWEAAQCVWLWRDASPSMAWRSSETPPLKRERAEVLLLALASLLIRGGERVALFGTGARPSADRNTLPRLAALLDGSSGEAADLPPPRPVARHAQTVFVGDFLTNPEATLARMRTFAGQGVRGHLIQVLDPAEWELPYRGRVRFEGTEDEGAWLAPRAEGLRPAYRARIAEHTEALRAAARRVGWGFTRHRTDRPATAALLTVYHALSAARGRA